MNQNSNKNTAYAALGIAGAIFTSIILATSSSKKRKKIPLSKTEAFFKEKQSVFNDNQISFYEAENTVRSWLYSAAAVIRNCAETDYEIRLSKKLDEMLNTGKIQLDDVKKRYETTRHPVHGDIYAFFDPYLDTVSNKPRNIIVIDVKKAVDNGYWEFVDTVAHEAWHAVQQELGLIRVDSKNQVHFSPSLGKLEKDAAEVAKYLLNKYKKAV